MVPNKPIGTLTRNTMRQSKTASTPPRVRPIIEPRIAAIWLISNAIPRWCDGKASVRIAVLFANRKLAPTP